MGIDERRRRHPFAILVDDGDALSRISVAAGFTEEETKRVVELLAILHDTDVAQQATVGGEEPKPAVTAPDDEPTA